MLFVSECVSQMFYGLRSQSLSVHPWRSLNCAKNRAPKLFSMFQHQGRPSINRVDLWWSPWTNVVISADCQLAAFLAARWFFFLQIRFSLEYLFISCSFQKAPTISTRWLSLGITYQTIHGSFKTSSPTTNNTKTSRKKLKKKKQPPPPRLPSHLVFGAKAVIARKQGAEDLGFGAQPEATTACREQEAKMETPAMNFKNKCTKTQTDQKLNNTSCTNII